jgi:hypothetical protein
MNENVDGESTYVKLVKERGSRAERTFKWMLWKATPECS